MTRETLRRVLVWGGLVLAVAASLAVGERPAEEAAVVSAVPPPSAPQKEAEAGPAPTPGVALARLSRPDWPQSDTDPFRAKSWYVAPPAPPPAPPPKPTAPPLPFKYMGALEDTATGGKTTVYLAKGSDSYQVAVGDTFADTYQLEKIERGQLLIRYLPLSVLQTLPTGWTE